MKVMWGVAACFGAGGRKGGQLSPNLGNKNIVGASRLRLVLSQEVRAIVHRKCE